ncbi:hypothetical protein [uncultured Polaribacter sp.]|uniref:hypothetical protein n=1 Tax=uncultured Polaribacter sp. TaxID=174711 RepID=UPI00262B2E37|nr:hypothetical protein [uncultured Polaribacter sp.]
MKNRKNNLIKLGIFLFGISLFLFNCEKDENTHQKHLTAQINYLQIEELPDVKSVLSELNNLGSSKNRSTISKSMNTDFGALNLNNILEYVNNDGKFTYSFLIDKDYSNDSAYTFENLHLVKTQNGYFGYILKWEPNEQWIEANDFNFSIQNFTGTQTHYDLDYNIIQIAEFSNGQIVNNLVGSKTSNRNIQKKSMYMEYVCISTFGDLCTDTGEAYCGGSICGFGVKTSCYWQEAGGGSATGGNDNDNDTDGESESGGGGGTKIPREEDSSDVDVENGDAIVVPALPEFTDPCNNLNDIIDPNKSNAKPFLENLKTTVDQPGENGFSMKKESDPFNNNATYTNTNLPATIGNSIGIPTGGQNYAGAHSHPSADTYPMFSWDDIYTLFNLYANAKSNVKNEVTFMLASKNNFLNNQVNVFALRIKDFRAFRSSFYKALSDIVNERSDLEVTDPIETKLKALNDKLGKKYGKTNQNQQEKAFLENFKDFNLSLFKANDNIDNWSEINIPTFTINTSGVKETPCN